MDPKIKNVGEKNTHVMFFASFKVEGGAASAHSEPKFIPKEKVLLELESWLIWATERVKETRGSVSITNIKIIKP